ncbi:MAG TPA: hypothetical protein VMI31_09390 [Fimbriimonadaceae bacterium]|nr:hypothetical protein [Fimbriimonadaceae bacterium]
MLRRPVLAVALIAVGSTYAFGWDDHITFKNQDRVNYYNIQCDLTGHNFDYGNYQTGSLCFDDDGHHTNIFGSGDFDCVCADIPDVINPGNNWHIDIRDAHDTGYGRNINCAGSIVGWVGDNICHDDLSSLTTEQACGLQLAVWEAIYDGVDPSSIKNESAFEEDLQKGNFSTSYNFSDKTILDCAYSYYKSGFDAGDNCVYLKSTDVGGQDQFKCNPGGGHGHVESTPEPFSMSLGLAAVGLFLRRRSKRSHR